MCGAEPFAYLRDVLIRITTGHTINRIAELAPWNYIGRSSDHSGSPPSDSRMTILGKPGEKRKVMAA